MNMDRHSGEGRNPAVAKACEADRNAVQSRYAGNVVPIWIPAFAGMTG
jgi:hypothetical protein